MSFSLTGKAKSDLTAIAIFTEQRWGKEQRNLYIKQMDEAFHRLIDAPMTGAVCDYIKSGYRKFPQGSHVIFYRKDSDNSIEIVRILHKSMDVESKFIKP
jgi:toxin ParE1/3/4